MDLSKLYPFQYKNASVLAGRQFGADLSDTGTGKTLTAMGVMKMTKADKILVVAPKSVAGQWERRFAQFWPQAAVFRATGANKRARLEAYERYSAFIGQEGFSADAPAVLVVTYEQVRMDIYPIFQLPQFAIAYADEVHRIGNPLTATAKAMMVLKTQRRYGATATPLRSSPLQAYGIFNWLKPGSLGKSYFHFQFRYTASVEREVPADDGKKRKVRFMVGYQHLDELANRIQPYYVKTTMKEAGLNLPPLVEEDVIFDLTPKQQRLYDKLKMQMLLQIEQHEIEKVENPTALYNTVVNMGKLQELTGTMELLGRDSESAKLDLLKDHLSDSLAGDNKAVIFTRFIRMADILARELKEYNPAMITGAIKDREAEIRKFDTDEKCKLIIVTTAGNEGIDLQRANLLYMYDVPMGSYGSLIQTIGRIERDGQTRPMVVYYLMAKKTVDIKFKRDLLAKKDMSGKLYKSWSEVKELLE